MNEEFRENVTAYFQRITPFLISAVMIFISYIPLNFYASGIMRPELGLICVFFWVLRRPDLFNMFSVFFLGLIDDILSSAPLGSNIIVYLTVYQLVMSMYSFFYNKPFIVSWYGFAFCFTSAELIRWLLVSVYYSRFLPISGVLFLCLFTIAGYPVVSWINTKIQYYMMNDEA